MDGRWTGCGSTPPASRTTIAERASGPAPALPEAIGHRGAAAIAPENTLPSIEIALDAGVRWIEFDVRLTADGVPVLLHDGTLDRTTDGRGPLAACTLDRLAGLDAGAWFDPAFRGTRVPTLEAALDAIGDRARVVVELKVDRPGEVELRDAALASLARRSDPGAYVFTSMDWDLLDGARERVPGVDVALTVRRLETRDAVKAAVRIGATAIHPHRARAGSRLVARAHQADLAVRAYTVNEEHHLAALTRAGVDAVFTDDPAWLLGLSARPDGSPR